MLIKLCKIKKDKFDELKKIVVDSFEATGELTFEESLIESVSEPICISGHQVEVEIDLDKYFSILQEEGYLYTKQAKVGVELHKDIKACGLNLPRNLFYEKEFWAFMSLTAFKDVVKGLRASLEEGKVNADKISRFYFNTGKINRTCLLFIWVMIDQLDCEDDFEIAHTAFEFVDPVKQALDYTMARNPVILKAFTQGIINNGKDSKFKSDKFRAKVSAHISCYASVSILDALDYEELVAVITEQQKAIITVK